MSDFDAWLNEYKPYIASAKVCGRADLIVEHQRREQALLAAKLAASDTLHDAKLSAAKKAIQEIETQIQTSEQEFTFQGIGQRQWQDLKRAHPPTDQQRADGLDADMESFAPALLAVSSVEPKLTPEQASKLMDMLPPGEYEKLFKAALEANGQVVGPPKSVLAAAIDALPQNGEYSTTAANVVSHDQSSSDGNAAL